MLGGAAPHILPQILYLTLESLTRHSTTSFQLLRLRGMVPANEPERKSVQAAWFDRNSAEIRPRSHWPRSSLARWTLLAAGPVARSRQAVRLRLVMGLSDVSFLELTFTWEFFRTAPLRILHVGFPSQFCVERTLG